MQEFEKCSCTMGQLHMKFEKIEGFKGGLEVSYLLQLIGDMQVIPWGAGGFEEDGLRIYPPIEVYPVDISMIALHYLCCPLEGSRLVGHLGYERIFLHFILQEIVER